MNTETMMLETEEDRKAFMNKVGTGLYSGKNEDGQQLAIVVNEGGMEISTYQKNHWVRVNYFNEDGFADGESFNGRWKD